MCVCMYVYRYVISMYVNMFTRVCMCMNNALKKVLLGR